MLPAVHLNEVPLRSCSGFHAILEGADVRVELHSSEAHGPLLTVVVDDSTLTVPEEGLTGLRTDRFCGWDEHLQRTLPYCSAARSGDGSRVYVHLIAGLGRKQHLVTWVFEEGRYLFRVEEEAVL
jgi:hypothetical protein